MGEEAVHGVEWEGHEEADQVCGGDPLVARTDGEHLRRDGPGDGQCVELLDVGSGPDVGTFDGYEDLGLVLDNAEQIISCGSTRDDVGFLTLSSSRS